jgi:uncharacterized protein DUF547
MRKRIRASFKYAVLTTISILLITLLIQGQSTPFTITSFGVEKTGSSEFDQSYDIYNSLLQKYVRNGKVNYQGFIESRGELEVFLKAMGSVDPADFNSWPEKDRLAFWINAYNAFTIKAIIDHYPIERSFSLIGIFYAPSNSILQIKGVWKKLRFRAVGRMVTLDEIEHEILRKEFDEPRIHMAIVCASISCPELSGEAYTGENIHEQLAAASVRFVNNPDKGVFIDEKDGRVKVSKIFKWFGEDFTKNYGDRVSFKNKSLKDNAVLNFILDYLISENKKAYINKDDYKLGYLEYDWHLNEMPGT